jgi:hypothetical protein
MEGVGALRVRQPGFASAGGQQQPLIVPLTIPVVRRRAIDGRCGSDCDQRSDRRDGPCELRLISIGSCRFELLAAEALLEPLDVAAVRPLLGTWHVVVGHDRWSSE